MPKKKEVEHRHRHMHAHLVFCFMRSPHQPSSSASPDRENREKIALMSFGTGRLVRTYGRSSYVNDIGSVFRSYLGRSSQKTAVEPGASSWRPVTNEAFWRQDRWHSEVEGETSITSQRVAGGRRARTTNSFLFWSFRSHLVSFEVLLQSIRFEIAKHLVRAQKDTY